jgi:hypothetical protein
MIKYVTLILFAVFTISCKNKTVNESSRNISLKKGKADSLAMVYPSLWVYGMPEDKDWQRTVIAQKLNFRFDVIAGDNLSSDNYIPEDFEKHNKKTDSILTKRIGINWRRIFEFQVDSLYFIDSIAISIVKSNSFISSYNRRIEKYNVKYDYYPNLQYRSHATPNDYIKLVEISGNGLINGSVEHHSIVRTTVDLKSKNVICIDTTGYSMFQ